MDYSLPLDSVRTTRTPVLGVSEDDAAALAATQRIVLTRPATEAGPLPHTVAVFLTAGGDWLGYTALPAQVLAELRPGPSGVAWLFVAATGRTDARPVVMGAGVRDLDARVLASLRPVVPSAVRLVEHAELVLDAPAAAISTQLAGYASGTVETFTSLEVGPSARIRVDDAAGLPLARLVPSDPFVGVALADVLERTFPVALLYDQAQNALGMLTVHA